MSLTGPKGKTIAESVEMICSDMQRWARTMDGKRPDEMGPMLGEMLAAIYTLAAMVRLLDQHVEGEEIS